MEYRQTMLVRRSCRAYTGTQLPEVTVERLMEAANLAPIGRKKYEEVHLTIVQNNGFLNELTMLFRAAVGDMNAVPFYGAPTLIVVSVRAQDGEVPLVSMANAACVVDHMHLYAADLGLGSVYIYGAMTVLRSNPDLVAQLNLPEGFLPASSLAVGYASDGGLPPRAPEQHFSRSELR